MRTTALTLLVCLAACGAQPTPHADPAPPAPAPSNTPAPTTPAMNDIYSLTSSSIDGKPATLADYRGKVTLIVNVASECGYTRQYAGLQKLHAELAGRGFAVLGFPSNEFGGQEPGSPEQIQQFCSSKFGVEFPLFAKCETKAGGGQSPIYAALGKATGSLPSWNFCKYLVGKNGEVIGFYKSNVEPDSPELRKAIEAAME